MINPNPLKALIIFILSALIFTSTAQAQDTSKTSIADRITWLTRMAHLKSIEDANHSVLARGYKPVGVNSDTSASTIILYRITGSKDYYGLSGIDGEQLTTCGYTTREHVVYDRMLEYARSIGFKPYELYENGPSEQAYFKDNDMLVFSTRTFQNNVRYSVTAARLNMLLP